MLRLQKKSIMLEMGGKEIALDSKGDVSFVSHAHSDHSSGVKSSKQLLASEATIDLLRARDYVDYMGSTEWAHDDVKLSFLEAGHVLGSKQLFAENSFSFTYTGDFKLADSLTLKGAEVKQTDFLLMECTFGSPEYKFPSRTQVYDGMASWAKGEMEKGHSIVFGGYELGKAQELIKFCNEYLQVAPVVTNKIQRICEVYEKHGVPLKTIRETSEEGKEQLKKQFVAIVPYHVATTAFSRHLSEYYKRKVVSAVATGWAATGRTRSSDAAFCLSDHCDFNELVSYVEQANPKQVICAFGYDDVFARELRKRGYNAVPLRDAVKARHRSLLEF